MIDQFHQFATAVDTRFNTMAARELFVVDCDRDAVWAAYLAAFPAGTNPVYRERTEHDCSCCRNFVKNIGNLAAYDTAGTIQTVWDVKAPGHYQDVANTMAEFIRSQGLKGVFRTKETGFGSKTSIEYIDGHAHKWDHFFNKVPAKFVTPSPETVIGQKNSFFQVLRRGLTELSSVAVDDVLDLIKSNNLYRGSEHLGAVTAFKTLKDGYDGTDAYVWANLNNRAAGFRNTVIGTLVTDLSAGVLLDKAVRGFESKVAPANYKRTTALITPNMITQAVQTLKDLDLESAVDRRYATIGDVSVNNVLFVDGESKPLMKDALTGISDLLMKMSKPVKAGTDGQDIDGETFFNQVLPGATGVSLYLANQHASNFVSLTAPTDPDVKPLFQWDNNFGWSYDGDVTDSVRERVKAAGGNVNALLRVSLSWFNYDDLDIHCECPEGHIYFANRRGILDVDMNVSPKGSRQAVENLAFKTLKDGVYKIYVNQFHKRENIDVGFEIEYEYNGQTEHFKYDRAAVGNVPVMVVHVRNRQVENVVAAPGITRGSAPITKWGLTSQQLVPVETVMLSPNYWDDQTQGNKHHFFFLKGCQNPGETRGIYNEFLRNELIPHRKVFEVLGAQTRCQASTSQLSGVGFSSTRKDLATFVVNKNGTNRTYNVRF